MAINEILSSVQINTTLAKYCVFKGAYPADRVPLMERSKNQAFIINTDTNDRPGSHWTALFIKSGECTFFDPFGSECMNVFLLKQLRNIGLKKYKYNAKQVQPFKNNNCGYFCISFILHMINTSDFTSFLCYFKDNEDTNNEICYKIISKYMNL